MRSRTLSLYTLLLGMILLSAAAARGQSDTDTSVVTPNQEVKIAALGSTVAASADESDVFVASIATAVMDRNVCCDRNSALETKVVSASGGSLRSAGEKLRGAALPAKRVCNHRR